MFKLVAKKQQSDLASHLFTHSEGFSHLDHLLGLARQSRLKEKTLDPGGVFHVG